MTTEPATLELVEESKLTAILGGADEQSWEASGIHFKDGYLHVVFDDRPDVARIHVDLALAGKDHTIIRQRGEGIGYEDLTYQPFEQRWYCLVETAEYQPGVLMSRIEEFDDTFRFVESRWLDFPLAAGNKGIEGLSTLRYRDEDYLLGMCEGNACKSGRSGREPGKGRILVFKKAGRRWERVGTIKLPKTVWFEDYAGLDFRSGYVTVVSQASSAMWVGKVRASPASLTDVFEDEGHVFLFPRDKQGRIRYCNLEGVTWIGDGKLAVVSDKAKPDRQATRCAREDQSIHIFRLPESVVRPAL